MASEAEGGSHLDAHVVSAQHVRDDVPFLVVERSVFVDHACFQGESNRGVSDRLELDLAALANHEDHRVAHVVGPRPTVAELHGRESRRGSNAELLDGAVRALDAVENGGAQAASSSPD